MKLTLDITASSVVRWILGALLIWAAVSKLANLEEFHGDLIAYRMPLPGAALRGIAMILPWSELICGMMLLARYRLDAALIWALFLFVMFLAATGQAWARGLNISCGCFDLGMIGIDSNSDIARVIKSTGFAFARALLLTMGAFYLWRMESFRARA